MKRKATPERLPSRRAAAQAHIRRWETPRGALWAPLQDIQMRMRMKGWIAPGGHPQLVTIDNTVYVAAITGSATVFIKGEDGAYEVMIAGNDPAISAGEPFGLWAAIAPHPQSQRDLRSMAFIECQGVTMTEVTVCIDLLRSKYYLSKIDIIRGVRLLVPHQFENVGAARQFTVQRKRGYNVVKEEYSGFIVQRGSQILDGPPLPIDFYIPNASPAGAPNMEEQPTL